MPKRRGRVSGGHSAGHAWAVFDFLQAGHQTWTIRFTTADGELLLEDGGARLHIAGVDQNIPVRRHHEYEGVYRHFADCLRAGASECDMRPLQIVADAFVLGRREPMGAFAF